MDREQLIEELENLNESDFDSMYLRKGKNGDIAYFPEQNAVEFKLIDYRDDGADVCEKTIYHLEPETILDLFRKWK